MALIIRIDVDRPYGRTPLMRHVLSRVSSDWYFPRFETLGFLAELQTMLSLLNQAQARSYVFFRRCTLPSETILDLIEAGGHQIGLHLENSRSFGTFLEEKHTLERHIGSPVVSLSKHGSGGAKFGFHHYAPYEPHRYVEWAQRASMRVFLGNLEDPSLEPGTNDRSILFFPSAFWLETPWRDTRKYPIGWLLNNARRRDIVLLLHPENVLADPDRTAEFMALIQQVESKILQ